ncbi:uncharacterized protein F4822DRAFT_443391 [Hypoxylon trugodes]|uniref:uncharacterized protein n=1 Tax=Hypoxylon trugodes TaxID=326681 RepID=UPI00218E18EB|nr:uncharacterized protein F4822DRAFT_443391 [Hypoxylon trugodes]KAI1388338.1 hypothetical protein F4822DRAFT_443391 [Hypoxylon trugodes]
MPSPRDTVVGSNGPERGMFDQARRNVKSDGSDASRVNYRRIQQDEIESLSLDVQPEEEACAYEIGLLMDHIDEPKYREPLAKNLLDSFALIFSQPGSTGVAATALRYVDDERTAYKLLIAKNQPFDVSTNSLAETIGEWFESRQQLKCSQFGEPTLQDNLWKGILECCYPSIRESIQKAWKGQNAQVWISTKIDRLERIDPRPRGSDSLRKILAHLCSYYMNELNLHENFPASGTHDHDKLMEILDMTARDCFKMLVVYRGQMGVVLKKCGMREASRRGFGRLIYLIGNYYLAWYDMARFRARPDSTKLQIELVQPGTLVDSGWTAVRPPKNSSKSKREQRPPWVHCEMQLFDLIMCDEHPEKFFNYIGCSKGPCWLCYHVLKYMTSRFRMRKSSLKLYPQWKPPKFQQSGPHEKRFDKVRDFLDAKIKGLVDLLEKGQLGYRVPKSDCPDLQEIPWVANY